jgi:LuxR family maltose regulon positive regulatory protein
LYEWNRLQEAESSAQQSLELVPRLDLARPSPWLTQLGLGVLARVALAQGHSERARQILESEAFDVAQFPVPQASKDVLILLPVRLALRCGQLDPALQWASTCGLHSDDPLASPLEKGRYAGYVALARVLIARGRGHPNASSLSQAQILLDRLLETAVRTSAHGRRIEIQMLCALALHAQGKTRQALSTLGPILAQAEPEGYLRLFADEGEVMAHLLARMAPFTTASPDYLQRIQAAIAPVRQTWPAATALPATLPPPFEPLSEREREVLQLVAEGLSNQQIAEHLVLSLHTVKLHVKHVLAKLDATNRTQAVVRARALHILPPS